MTQFGGQAIVGEYPLPAKIKFIIPISKAQIIINCLKRLIEKKKLLLTKEISIKHSSVIKSNFFSNKY